jgi:predicted DNA-binding antitoxin AbrB/MazE fold protein
MLKTLWAEVKQGKIELLEPADLPEGTKVLVTLLPTKEAEQWLQGKPSVSDDIWDDIEDKVEVPSLSE